MRPGLIAVGVTWRTVVQVTGALLLVATLVTVVGVRPAHADFGDWEGTATIEGDHDGYKYRYDFTVETLDNDQSSAQPIEVDAKYDLVTPNGDCFIHSYGTGNTGTGTFVIAWQPAGLTVGVSLVPWDVPITITDEYGGPVASGCEQKTEVRPPGQVSSLADGGIAVLVDPLQEAVVYSETTPADGQLVSFRLTRSICTGYDTDGDGVSDCDEVPNHTDPTDPGSMPPLSRITPTATTCGQFANGTAATLQTLRYSLKGQKIQQVDPGVFFYWVRVADGGTYTITQTPAANTVTKTFAMANGSFGYDSGCVKQSAKPAQGAAGAVSIIVTGPGYIGIKYSGSSLAGQGAPNPSMLHYDLATTEIAGSTKGLDLSKKN